MNTAPAARDRTLSVLLAVLGLLVVTAIAVVFFRPDPALRGAGTPEGVVQRYAAAAIDGDERAATGYLREAPEPCGEWESEAEENLRVSLVSTDTRGTSAEVAVSVVSFSPGGPFGSSEYETQETFQLTKAGGSWLIDTVPWRLRVCDSGPAR
jgi:hypothetical protein